MPIAAEEYLHFYYEDAKIPLFSAKEVSYDFYIRTQINLFRQRIQLMQQQSGLGQADFERILEIFLSDEDKTKKRIYDTHQGDFATLSGLQEKGQEQITDLTYAELGAKIRKSAQEVADSISTFQDQLTKYLDLAWKKISLSDYSNYQNRVLLQYLWSHNRKSSSSLSGGSHVSRIRQSIISDFLTHNGLNSLKLNSTTGTGGFETSIRNLTLLAYALPELVNYSNSSTIQYSTGDSIKNKQGINKDGVLSIEQGDLPELFRVINAKIAGGFRNLTGIGGELAWEKAEQESLPKIEKAFKDLNEYLNAQKDISVKSTGADRVQRGRAGEKLAVSKGDVSVIIDNGKIKIGYGISVKNYKKPTSRIKTGHISVGSFSNFYDLATQKKEFSFGISPYKLLHSAASQYKKKEDGGHITETQLEESWNEIRHFVAVRNFLNLLAGEAYGLKPGADYLRNASDNVLVLVINGNAFTIDEVLEKILNKEWGISESGSVSRKTLKEKNKWKEDSNHNGSEDEAEFRGRTAWKDVEQALRQAKLKISITNIAASLF